MSDSIENPPGAASSADDLQKSPTVPSSIAPSRPQRLSIVFKLTLLMGGALALLLGVLLTAGWFFWREAIQKQVDDQLSSVAASRRDTVEAQLALLRQRVELNTDRGEFRAFFYEKMRGEATAQNLNGSQGSLDRVADREPIISASLVNEAGEVLLSSSPAEVGKNLSGDLDFSAGLVAPHVGLPQRTARRFEANLFAPVKTRSEPVRTYGTLWLRADLTELADALRDVTGLGKTGEAILGLRVGDQIRFLFPPRNAPNTASIPASAAPALKAAVEGRETLTHNPDYRGVPVLAAGRPVGSNGWGLVVKMDEREAYEPITRASRRGLFFGLAVAAVGLAAAYALARSFTRPIRQIAQAAARVAKGEQGVSVPVRSGDEFGELSANFNEMTAAIGARRSERDHAVEALRNADRHKDEFLAMLGHELRNPLSAIAHAARLAQDTPHDSGAAELARGVIARQTRNLSRLVDDLLDVARISEGRIDLRKCAVDLGLAIRRAVEAVRPLIDERRHNLDLSLAGSGQRRLDADPMRIEQIITNLITNAAKYTPDGGRITVTERYEEREAIVSVSDNGVGIAPEMLPKIFELFTQADRSLDRTSGGLGIGLSLCRQLVQLHGGSIFAQSDGPGHGATFTVRLPAIREPEPTPLPRSPARPAPQVRRRRILLVDDNKDTVRSLSRLLALRGHEVATAFDGLEAVEVAHQFKPNVLLLDIGLPGLDGYALAKRLRGEGFAAEPMIAISGYAQEGDRNRAREAGFNHHFAKPVDFEALAELIVEEPLAVD